jgi:hypothetical protein
MHDVIYPGNRISTIRGESLKKAQPNKSGISGLIIVWTIIAVIVVIVAALLLAYPSLLRGGGCGGGSETWHAGDFIKWGYFLGNETTGDPYSYTQFTVTDVNSTG